MTPPKKLGDDGANDALAEICEWLGMIEAWTKHDTDIDSAALATVLSNIREELGNAGHPCRALGHGVKP